MIHRRLGAIAAIVIAAMFTAQAAQAPPSDALARLGKVRAAMGGAAELAAIKTLRLTGSTSGRLIGPRSRGSVLGRVVVDRVEIQVILPDHYLHLSPQGIGAGPTTSPSPAANSSRRGGFAAKTPIGRDRIAEVQESFGYLMLGLLMKTDTPFPFALRAVSGDTLRFANLSGVDVFVDLDPTTQLPICLRVDITLRTLTGELTNEHALKRIELSDYRPVGRLRLAHRTIEFTGDRPNPLTRQFETIELNPKLNRADFK